MPDQIITLPSGHQAIMPGSDAGSAGSVYNAPGQVPKQNDQDIRNSILQDFSPPAAEPASGKEAGEAVNDETIRASILDQFAPPTGKQVAGTPPATDATPPEWSAPGGGPSPSAQRVSDAFATAQAGGVDTNGRGGSPMLMLGGPDLLNWMRSNPKKAEAIGTIGALVSAGVLAPGALPAVLRGGGGLVGKFASGALQGTGAYEALKLLSGDTHPAVGKLMELVGIHG